MTLDSFEGLLVRYFAECITTRIPDVFPMIRLGLVHYSQIRHRSKVPFSSYYVKGTYLLTCE